MVRGVSDVADADKDRHHVQCDITFTGMPDTQHETIKAHCPNCGADRNADIRGKHVLHRSDEETSSADTCLILQCRGCEALFFRRDYWFSEWETIVQNPYTGELEREGGTETTYWPAPVQRKPPEWLNEITLHDKTLANILSEMYAALNNDLRILAAIGARTAFDRTSELLSVDPSATFNAKLDALVSLGKVSSSERESLEILVDAGSAAAHRAWVPKPAEIETMMVILEALLHRTFILGDGLQRLQAAVPPRPTPG
jgi:hypothetical protein